MLFDIQKFLKDQYLVCFLSNLVCFFQEYIFIHASDLEDFSFIFVKTYGSYLNLEKIR